MHSDQPCGFSLPSHEVASMPAALAAATAPAAGVAQVGTDSPHETTQTFAPAGAFEGSVGGVPRMPAYAASMPTASAPASCVEPAAAVLPDVEGESAFESSEAPQPERAPKARKAAAANAAARECLGIEMLLGSDRGGSERPHAEHHEVAAITLSHA